MEQIYRQKSTHVTSGSSKDKPLCERCGRPVKLSSEDYLEDEILCPTCAAECSRISSSSYFDDQDY